MAAPKIAFICASLREGSINKTLEKALIKRFKAAGAKTSSIDLSKYEMPIYHGDLETPATVKKFITRLKSFDGIVFVSPEYNGCLPALNTRGDLVAPRTSDIADNMRDMMLERIRANRGYLSSPPNARSRSAD